jgi:tetratricopeptide (TPR) repeat protein
LGALYFASRKSTFDDARVYSAMATAKLKLGDVNGALDAYRSVLETEKQAPGIKTNAFVEYPYLVATRGLQQEFGRALAVLDANADALSFPVIRFMWAAAYALIAAAQGQRALAKEHAAEALRAADEKSSEFRYHRSLGLVGKEHDSTIRRLRAVA